MYTRVVSFRTCRGIFDVLSAQNHMSFFSESSFLAPLLRALEIYKDASGVEFRYMYRCHYAVPIEAYLVLLQASYENQQQMKAVKILSVALVKKKTSMQEYVVATVRDKNGVKAYLIFERQLVAATPRTSSTSLDLQSNSHESHPPSLVPAHSYSSVASSMNSLSSTSEDSNQRLHAADSVTTQTFLRQDQSDCVINKITVPESSDLRVYHIAIFAVSLRNCNNLCHLLSLNCNCFAGFLLRLISQEFALEISEPAGANVWLRKQGQWSRVINTLNEKEVQEALDLVQPQYKERLDTFENAVNERRRRLELPAKLYRYVIQHGLSVPPELVPNDCRE
ncbi:hypothetical protein BDZ97DRAFT_1823261 [Flammula alnicola]|nr:hypothetical protein BDZ97DRAFT_1823261 [Flammula alnicola]